MQRKPVQNSENWGDVFYFLSFNDSKDTVTIIMNHILKVVVGCNSVGVGFVQNYTIRSSKITLI